MPNSKADTAKSAPAAGTPGAEDKARPHADDQASKDAPTPKNGITITRRGFGISLPIAVAVLGGAFGYLSNRISGVEDQVRDLRGELHTEINGLRQEVRTEIRDLRYEVGTLRHEMRDEIGTLRDEMRADIGALRDQVQELAILIRTRDAAAQ